MTTEMPNQPEDSVGPQSVQDKPPPPSPQQSTEMDWSPPPWLTDPIPPDGSPPAPTAPLKKAFPRFAAIIGLVGVLVLVVLVGLAVTTTRQPATPVPSGLAVPTDVPVLASPAPVSPSPTPGRSSTLPGDQPHGPLRKPKEVDWDQLKVGDCFKDWTDTGVPVTRVDCRSPHEEEGTGAFNVPGGRRYPGDDAVEGVADALCESYFARYTGIGWDSSSFDYDYFTPDASSWRHGDRLTTCTAWDSDHPDDNTISLRNIRK
jgi:Septum formation